MTTVLASSGQIDGTWTWAGLDSGDARRYLLPGSTEFAVVGFLLIGQYALYKKHSPFLWWQIAAAFAVLAVLMNSVHGDPGHKIQQGMIFGGASAASLGMWFAKFWIDYLGVRRERGEITGLRPKAWTFKAARSFPRIAFRADLIIARCEKVATRERAYELAEMWRWVYEDAREGGENRKTASRTAWMTVYLELGMKVIEPRNIKLAKVTFAPPPPPPPVAPPPPPASPAAPKAQQAPATTRAPQAPPAAAAPPKNPPPAGPPAEMEVRNPEWWKSCATQIEAAKVHIPDWLENPRATTVEKIQKGDGTRPGVPGCGNRDVATQVAACIRVLRNRHAAASN